MYPLTFDTANTERKEKTKINRTETERKKHSQSETSKSEAALTLTLTPCRRFPILSDRMMEAYRLQHDSSAKEQ